jgi:hypothetical protein
MMALLPRLVGRHQMLAPVLDPFDRPAEPQRRECHEKIFGVKLAADAEAAAGVALFQHHGGRVAAEHARQGVSVAVRHLGGAVEFEHVAGGVEAGERAARLERDGAVPADLEIDLDDRIGGGEGGLDIPVAGAQCERLGRQAGRKTARRAAGVEQRRHRLGLDRDEIGGVLGEVRIGGKHCRDRLADVAQPLAGEQRLAVGAQRLDRRVAKIDRRQTGEVGRGPHRDDAGRQNGGGDVDTAQPRMRERRAHHAHVQLAREGEVGDEGAAPHEERRVLEPRQAAPQSTVHRRTIADRNSRPMARR